MQREWSDKFFWRSLSNKTQKNHSSQTYYITYTLCCLRLRRLYYELLLQLINNLRLSLIKMNILRRFKYHIGN